jgi:ribosomal protein S21
MSIQIKKNTRETSQNLVRRFSRRIQQSGVLRRARNIRFTKRSKSDQLKKKTALRKQELKKEYQILEKLGKEPEKRGRRY